MKAFEPIDWRQFQPQPVIGVDEVGRGCLVGNVYAAAVLFKSEVLADQVTDSKLLSEKRREELSALIFSEHYVGIGSATPSEIDSLNILQASLLAMQRAVQNLMRDYQIKHAHLLIDGNQKIKSLLHLPQTTIVKGDLRVAPISAASIVAKVARDQTMKELSFVYPEYGFEKHKGYSTVQHKAAIAKHGPCPEHRKSFAGVKEYCTSS